PGEAAGAAGPGGARAPAGHMGVRSDAREYHHRGQRVQDPPVRGRRRGGRRLLRCARGGGHRARRSAHRADRRRRDRSAGRWRRDRRGGSAPSVRDARRPPPQPRPVARDGVPGGGAADEGVEGLSVEPIDLRSDTLTRPDERMRRAMADAPVGDDVYGEDPTVNALEARVAEMFGHEAGLFCASGSLANMVGVAASVGRGEEVLAESRAHILRSEVGGHGAIAGITSRTWISPDGTLEAADALALAESPRGYSSVGTALIAVENTHNFSGGRIAAIDQLRELRARTAERGLRGHMDGARVANAVVAEGSSFADQGAVADSVSICLSKGLGAPVGSVLTGSRELIDEARYLRKRYGGGM